jgi:hypothetical protein
MEFGVVDCADMLDKRGDIIPTYLVYARRLQLSCGDLSGTSSLKFRLLIFLSMAHELEIDTGVLMLLQTYTSTSAI